MTVLFAIVAATVVVTTPTAPGWNWPQMINALTPLALAALTGIAGVVGWALRRLIATRTIAAQQTTLESFASRAVQMAEQQFSSSGNGPAKYAAAATVLREAAKTHLKINLSATDVQSLIEPGVRALNAGAVGLFPGSTPVLLPDVSATGHVDVDVEGLKADLLRSVTPLATGVAKSVIRDLLGVGVATQTAATDTAPSPPATNAAVHIVKAEDLTPGSQVLVHQTTAPEAPVANATPVDQPMAQG